MSCVRRFKLYSESAAGLFWGVRVAQITIYSVVALTHINLSEDIYHTEHLIFTHLSRSRKGQETL